MKQFSVITVALLVLSMCLTACASSNESVKENSTKTTSQNGVSSSISGEEIKDTDAVAEPVYKIIDSISTENSSGAMGKAYIELPEVYSTRKGRGQVARQSDDTLIILGGQHLENALTTDEIDKVLNDFFFQAIDVLDKYRDYDFKDHKFEISGTEKMTINDYQMCKYVGEHTFTNNGVSDKMNYVAYVAKLKSNDAYVYWIVLDESNEQNKGDVVEKHAINIANSLYE